MIAIFKYLKDYYVAESRGNKAVFFFFLRLPWEKLDRSCREPDKQKKKEK